MASRRSLDRRCRPLSPPPGATAGEQRQAAEQLLFVGRKQLVTPGDGITHRLQPGREIASASRQQRQALLQPAEERHRRQHLDACGGQFDGQGQAVQATTDGGDGAHILIGHGEVRIDCLGTERKEPHRWGFVKRVWRGPMVVLGERQWRHREFSLVEMRRRTRLVTREPSTPGNQSQIWARMGAASTTCSKLSMTSSRCLSWSRVGEPLQERATPVSRSPKVCAMVITTRAGSRIVDRSTKRTPSTKAGPSSCAMCRARRVFPTPPVPVSVSNRTSSRYNSALTAVTSRARPTSGVSGAGKSRTPRSYVAEGWRRPPLRRGNEGGPLRARQSQGLDEQPQGVLARDDPNASLEIAQATHAESRARGQFLLCQSGGLPVPPQQIPEDRFRWRWHCVRQPPPRWDARLQDAAG